ncbi:MULTISPECIES: heavy-metal-associated domain-containing protein [unclassified Thioalkalivibrio]|uniref:heavy-metal-associated domain-containing protein n=1 Tax=unclassified Thioalkalivibrio TaxID=2621013 RepID=UPI0001959AFB|nr:MULTISPECIES: heavy metal-associated domain-containing protein [unclassified Thioalkalivibrio]ADC72783.1 Heavy metal transport/detoxification protein [Thioalkalivibrio sp. K90mix]
MKIEVENIKCGGCASSIRKGLMQVEGVTEAEVDVEGGAVEVHAPDSAREAVAAKLASMGYPEVGSVSGLRSASAKAKSFASCAVGRMSGD